jgi:hypothetical protein
MRVCDHIQNVNRTDTRMPRSVVSRRRPPLQAVDEVRRSLRVAGCREDRAVVCLDAPCSGVEVLVTSAPAEIAR